jgi:diketogulonate reductase-like aldo/keto reductase
MPQNHFVLRDGHHIPAIGFGTWQAKPREVEKAVEVALRLGYRHIDCAAIYRNEAEVGNGIRNSGIDRRNIFVCSASDLRSKIELLMMSDRSRASCGTHLTDQSEWKRH